jgi:hypothetical protein
MGKAVFHNGEFYVIGGETLDGPGATEDNVYRGLAGLFLLDDPDAGALPAPTVAALRDRYLPGSG